MISYIRPVVAPEPATAASPVESTREQKSKGAYEDLRTMAEQLRQRIKTLTAKGRLTHREAELLGQYRDELPIILEMLTRAGDP